MTETDKKYNPVLKNVLGDFMKQVTGNEERQASGKGLDKIFDILKWMVLLFYLFVCLYPLFWLFVSSLKANNLELQTNPFWLPEVWHFENYVNAMQMAHLPRLFINSVLVAFMAVGINLLVTSMAAFVFSREKFKGRNILYISITAGVLVPIISFMVPYFSVMTKIGLYDSLLGLGLVYSAINVPISIFLITAFMEAIPQELEEAAIIDGCNFYRRYSQIVLPLARSGLVTAGTLCFIYSWNDFIMALLLTSSAKARTVQLGIRFFTSQFLTDYVTMYAAIFIAIVPSVIIYAFFHNKIISGLTAGAVKG